MVRRFGLGILFASALVSTGPAAAIGNFSSGNWTGEAVVRNNEFRQCNMWAPYINQWDLGFALTKSGELRLGLRSAKLDVAWRMIFDQQVALRMQIDDSPVAIKAFSAVNGQLISTSIADLDWHKRLRTGKFLRINTNGRVSRFSLNGIDAALTLLYACVAKYQRG